MLPRLHFSHRLYARSARDMRGAIEEIERVARFTFFTRVLCAGKVRGYYAMRCE